MPLPKRLNPALNKAISESYSDKQYAVFNRVEKKFTAVSKSKLARRLASYREEGKLMDFLDLFEETHCSATLGKFMRASNMPRPGANWEAHHMISGAHKEAELARAVLADDDIKIRIDDSVNGCWMPKTKKDARPTLYPNAIGHNRIHRDRYYTWITNRLGPITDPDLLASSLGAVRAQLMHGNLADELLEKEIDHAEYKDWMNKSR